MNFHSVSKVKIEVNSSCKNKDFFDTALLFSKSNRALSALEGLEALEP